jgi:hypothetical protein
MTTICGKIAAVRDQMAMICEEMAAGCVQMASV